jgi:hypothetical protein
MGLKMPPILSGLGGVVAVGVKESEFVQRNTVYPG